MATVVLANPGAHKIQVIKVVRSQTGWGLKEAKDFVDHTPGRFEGLSPELAETLAAELQQAGAMVEIEAPPGELATAGGAAPGTGAPAEDLITKLERLTALHASGGLDDGEFQTLKARLIAGDE